MQKKYHMLLDTKGLICPMPILKAKKALKAMSSGEILKIEATDPASEEDFKAFVKQNGDVLLHIELCDDIFKFLIQKG